MAGLKLTELPADILTYLIYDFALDRETLKSLALSCKLLSPYALRLLRSERVILSFNVEDGPESKNKGSEIASDFITGSSNRVVGLVRQLTLNVNFRDGTSLPNFPSDVQPFENFVSKSTELLRKCRNIDWVLIRSKRWVHNSEENEVFRWLPLLLECPSIKTLLIDPCGVHRFRSFPSDEYLAEIEGVNCITSTAHESRGISCLSIQTPGRSGYSYHYAPFADCIRRILLSNTNTLSRLWVRGLEFHDVLKQLPDGGLSNLRLKSFSIRSLTGIEDIIRVFGLKERVPTEDGVTFLPDPTRSDPFSTLECLYLSDGWTGVYEESQLLQYIDAPKLRSLNLGNGFFNMLQDRRGFERFLDSMKTLRRFGASLIAMGNFHYQAAFRKLIKTQSKLETISFWQLKENDYSHLRRVASQVRNIEIMHTSMITSIFQVLGVISTKEGILSGAVLGQAFHEEHVLPTSLICSLISTILHIQNVREGGRGVVNACDKAANVGSKAQMCARESFIKNAFENNLAPRMGIIEKNQEIFVSRCLERYIMELIHEPPAGQHGWDERKASILEEWFATTESGGRVGKAMVAALLGSTWPTFKTLELRFREETSDPWPRQLNDRIFVWEKPAPDRWEFKEISD